MTRIYVLRKTQESPKIETIVFSNQDRNLCIQEFKRSGYEYCFLEEWEGTVVKVRNVLVKDKND